MALTMQEFAALVARQAGRPQQGTRRPKCVTAIGIRRGDMSEGSGGAEQAPRSRGPIRSPRDFWGGIGLIVLALFAVWACSDLPGMRGFAFGPGTAPRMFAYCLLGLGIAISLVGLLSDGEPPEPFATSGPFGASVLLLVLIPLSFFSARISSILPGVAADVVYAAVTA